MTRDDPQTGAGERPREPLSSPAAAHPDGRSQTLTFGRNQERPALPLSPHCENSACRVAYQARRPFAWSLPERISGACASGGRRGLELTGERVASGERALQLVLGAGEHRGEGP